MITRQDFLSHLKVMSERDGCTIIYATHIFDGLDGWPTHLAMIAHGAMQRFGRVEEFEDLTVNQSKGVYAPLLRTIEAWMRGYRAAFLARSGGVEEKEKAGKVQTNELTGELGNGYLPGRLGGARGFN